MTLQKTTKHTLYIGLGTLLFFGLGGVIIVEHVQGQNFMDLLGEGVALHWQLLYGLLAGAAGSGVALLIITRSFFKNELAYYSGLISRLDLNGAGMVFLSLCAGIGEELFFRAGIQPLLGIWWTSVIFVGLHGYLNPMNMRISVYGLVLINVIAGFGYLFDTVGIFSAMTAHAFFDLVLFVALHKEQKSQTG